MRSNNEVTNGKPVTDEQFFHYFSGMKRMLLAIACLACGGAANAQLYRDSLYKAYKETFHSLRGHELEYNRVLFQTAERVFSVKHPAMVYAIKESRLEDSAAMAMLGREVVIRESNDGKLSEHGEEQRICFKGTEGKRRVRD